MAKKEVKKFAEEEVTEETEKTPRFKIGGAWRNEDKNQNGYLVTPLNPEAVKLLIEELQEHLETGCKILTYTNGFRTDEKHPHFISYVYPMTKKSEE